MSKPGTGEKVGNRLFLLTIFIWVFLSGTPCAQSEDYGQWARSMRIGINTTSSGAGLSTFVNNFPMLVRLPAGHPAFAGAKAGGADIRFSDPDGSHLGYEIERWDAAAGKAEIWVKIPVVDGNSDKDYFTMHWGKADALSRSDGLNVFAREDQVATWHFAQSGAASRTNSARGDNPAQPVNYDGDESREGHIGRCDSLDGGEPGDYLDLGDGFADFTAGFTFSAWISSSSEPSWSHILDLGNGKEKDNVVVTREGTGVNPAVITYGNGVLGDRVASPSGGLERDRWRHLAFTISGAQGKVFVDGSLVASGNLVVALAKVTRTLNFIGKSNWSNPYFKGKVDEASLATSVRSAEWIRLSYESQKSASKVLGFLPIPDNGLSLLTSPADLSVPEGASAVFSVTAASDGTVSYRWYRDGLPLAPDGRPLVQPAPNLLMSPDAGVVHLELSIPSAGLANAGSYVCVITDGRDTVRTVAARLNVSENPALWTRSMKVGFNTTSSGAAVNSPQKNFPVPIRLSAANFDFATAAPGGKDIRAVDADASLLAFQISLWDTVSKRAEIWVRVPEVAGNSDADHITLLWGRADATPASNPAAVFRAEDGYQGVWHLNDPSGTVAADASANLNHGKVSGPLLGKTGILGNAFRFEGGSNHVNLPLKATDGLKAFTVSLWAREIAAHGCDEIQLCPTLFGGETAEHSSRDFWFGARDGKLVFQTGLGSGTTDAAMVTTAAIDDAKWHYVAATYDGAAFTLFEAGRAIGSKPGSGGALASQTFDIGNIHWSDDTRSHGFDGDIDAVQFAAAARSADWLKLAYETQREGGSTMVYGPVAKPAPPKPSILPAAGAYPAPVTVTLAAADSGIAIYYTLDGTAPVVGGAGTFLYSKSLALDRSATVTAVAYRDGQASPTASAAYVLTRALGNKDTLRAGEVALLAGGHLLRYPAQNGTLSVTVETGAGAGAVPAGFLAIGGPIKVSSAGPDLPRLQVILAGTGAPVSLFRLEAAGTVSWALSAADTLSIASPGAYFWGADIQTPVIRMASAPTVSNDTLRAVFRVEDNVRNLLCGMHYWSGSADSTGWAPCAAGGDVELRVPVPARSYAPLELRFSAGDRAITSHYPDGPSHALTVSRPLPSLPGQLALAAGGKWTLAALPLAPAEHIHLKDLAAANGGAALSAGIWQAWPDLPEHGTYRILGGEDTLPGGVGFWLSSDKDIGNLILPPARSLASDSQGCFPMRFTRGWNLVAGPALRALPWVANRRDGDAYLQSDLKMLHRFTGSGYAETDSIRPWEGYFVYHHGGDTLIRLRSSSMAFGALAKAAPSLASAEEAGISLQLAGAAGGASLRLGARAWASDGLGVEDEPVPPSGLAGDPGLRLLRDGRALGSDFVRLREDEAMSWTIGAKAAVTGGRLRILQSSLPEGYQAWAVSRAGRVKLRLGPDGVLPLAAGDTVIVYAGTDRVLAGLPELRGYRESPALAECRLRPGPRGPELFLAVPGISRVTLGVWRADGSRRGGWASRVLGPGWHSLPLAGDGAVVLPRGAYWVEVAAQGQNWRFRRLIPFSNL